MAPVTSEEPSPSVPALEKSLKQARKDVSACIFASSWTVTVPGVAISVPVSIYMKTYSPLVFTAVLGSGIDYYLGMSKCEQLIRNVKAIELQIAKSKFLPDDDRKAV